MDITNKAVKVSRAICRIEECLANGDLLACEADDLRIELEELREWDDLLNAYFTARNNGEKLEARNIEQLNNCMAAIAEANEERDAALAREAELVAQVENLKSILRAVQSVPKRSGFAINDTNHKAEMIAWMKLNGATEIASAQFLRDVESEAGRAGFVACIKLAYELQHPPGTTHADQYAASVKAGEV